MKNLNLKLILTFSISNKKIRKESKDNWIYSLFATNTIYDINYTALVKRLNENQCEKLFIFNILPLRNFSLTTDVLDVNYESNKPISYKNPFYVLRTMSFKEFFNAKNLNSLTNDKLERFDYDPIINHAVFIFNQIPLPFIIASFYLHDIALTQGANSKRGVLSSVHFRLSLFLGAVQSMKKNSINTITRSFHDFNNLAIQPTIDYTTLDKNKCFNFISTFYITLEEYFKSKFNINENDNDFTWDLTKNQSIDFNEFTIYLKQKLKNNNVNNTDKNNIQLNNNKDENYNKIF